MTQMGHWKKYFSILCKKNQSLNKHNIPDIQTSYYLIITPDYLISDHHFLNAHPNTPLLNVAIWWNRFYGFDMASFSTLALLAEIMRKGKRMIYVELYNEVLPV